MLTHIVGLLKPDEGRILVDGQDITELTEDKLAPIRRKITGFSIWCALRFHIGLGKCRIPADGRGSSV